MPTVKRYEVGETKCLDNSAGDRALLMGCGNNTIISLEFDKEKCTHAQVDELVRMVRTMGLTAVEVQTGR